MRSANLPTALPLTRKQNERSHMRTAIKRTITILIIAALSIGCGVLFDRICDRVERERYPRMYTDSVMKHSADLGIPANVIYAVMKVESNFDSGLKTETGDADRIGLMQLTADDYKIYASAIGMNTDPGLLYEPETNLTIGCYRISELYKKYTDWKCVFAAMRVGTDKVDTWLGDATLTDKNGRLTKIPDTETAEFVAELEATVAKYNKLYN